MGKYCERGAYIAVCQLKEEDGPLSPSWEVLRVLSAKRNYNITHQEGDNEISPIKTIPYSNALSSWKV